MRFGSELPQSRLGFRDHALVAFFLSERDEPDIVVEFAGDTGEARQRSFKLLTLAHQALRARRVAPEIRRFGERVEIG
jgi:hypothetical protein